MNTNLRKSYIKRVVQHIGNNRIKIFIGMKGAGKRSLLKQLDEFAFKEVPSKNKLYVDFENAKIKDDKELYEHVKNKFEMIDGKKYLFFSEIQQIEGWYKLLYALNETGECDIYVTASNREIFSKEMLSLIKDKYEVFEVPSLTFKEIFINQEDKKERFYNYLQIGGFQKANEADVENSLNALKMIYGSTIYAEIALKKNIRDFNQLNEVLIVIVQNIGNPLTATVIKNIMTAKQKKITVDTALSYIEALEDANIIKKAPLYDIKTKKELKTEGCYYLADHALAYVIDKNGKQGIEAILKNIVFNELLTRGYEVKAGRSGNVYIDFIAEKEREKKYYQVRYKTNAKTIKNEIVTLVSIKDNFEKEILTLDDKDYSTDGIRHKNIVDFLLS